MLVALPLFAYANALSNAVLRGNVEKVKLLVLKDEVNINAKDKYGSTALMYAVSNGHLEIIQFLV